MTKKDLVRLQLMLRQIFERRPLQPGDSVYVVPLPNEMALETECLGLNNAFPALLEKKLKVLL